MKKHIVITSIFNPTQAVLLFSKMQDYQLIVVGDKKTPFDWCSPNVDYISIVDQENLRYQLLKELPYNHYSRKMIGYVKAIKEGAEYIVDTDDDNIPKDTWSFPDFENLFECTSVDKGFINIYQLFTKQKIWPRGLPLRLISEDFNLEKDMSINSCKIGIWQGLADEDPDVDAIYRLTDNAPCFFEEREPVVLGAGTISPFNSQNTIFRKELFPLMYLPAYVTFRFTDILRGLVAQPIMWLYGYQLGFTAATVVQKRNPHDYMEDFVSEIPMYQHCEKVVELVTGSISVSASIEENLLKAYEVLFEAGIVCDKEIVLLKLWLNDIKEDI